MTNFNKKLLYTAGLLTVANALLADTTSAEMTIAKTLERTIETNPQIQADISSAKSREHIIRRQQAGYLPKIDASVTFGYESTRNKFWANSFGGNQKVHTEKFRSNPGITLTQNLFDGFKTTTDVEKATADYVQGEKKVDETIEQTAFRAANAYIDVRRFQRLLREARRNLAAHKKISGKVEELVKGGKASTADRATLQARIATAANAVADIQGDLDTAVAEFKAITGVEPDRLVTARIRQEYLPPCLTDAISIAHDNNKSVILAKSSIDVAVADMEGAKTAYMPTFGIEANVNRAQNNAGKKGYADTGSVLAVFRYNLYNGGADMARVDEFSERVSQMRNLLEAEYRTSEEEVRKSWAQMRSSEASAKEVRKSVIALKEEMSAFEKQYEIGTRTLIDVLGATNEYFLARGALITTDAATDIAGARLLAAMGVLTEKYGYTRPTPSISYDIGRTDLVGKNYNTTKCENLKPSSTEIEAEKDELLKNVAEEITANVPETPAETFTQDLAATDNNGSSSWFSDWFSSDNSDNQAPANTSYDDAEASISKVSYGEGTTFPFDLNSQQASN